jgi:hypothetical protein
MESRDNSTNSKSGRVNQMMEQLREILSSLPDDRRELLEKEIQVEGLVWDLKREIVNSGLTHYRLAKMSGVDISGIDRFMSGERDLTFVSAGKLADALGLMLVSTGKPPETPAKAPPETPAKASKKSRG